MPRRRRWSRFSRRLATGSLSPTQNSLTRSSNHVLVSRRSNLMRIQQLWAPLALSAALGLVAAAVAEADNRGDAGGRIADKGGKGAFQDGKGPGGKGPGGKGPGGPGGRGPGGFGGRGGRGLSADQIVDHLMSFDKNKDGKITKDELPERMQALIARGDGNKDNVLDRDEVRKLAGDLARDGDFRLVDGAGGPGGPGGRGFGGPGGPGRGGPPFGGRANASLERAVDDLRLGDKTK